VHSRGGGGFIDLLLSLLTSAVYVKIRDGLVRTGFPTYIRIPDFIDLVVMSHATFHDVDAVSIARFHLKRIKITYMLQNRYVSNKMGIKNE
jgi:hypothetical protein